jgi:hypothetical protein
MSLFSARLGLVLLGLGILFLGLYLQRKAEGFQASGEGSGSGSGPAKAAIIPHGDVVMNLHQKDAEIRNKFKMINANKVSTDVILTKYINSDLMNNLNILHSEVASYVHNMQNIDKTYTEASSDNQTIMSQLVYTTADQVNMLYYIYYTYPSTIISTNTTVQADSARPSDLGVDEVLKDATTPITALLVSLPTATTKMTEFATRLFDTTNALTKDQNTSLVSQFNTNLIKYTQLVELQMKTLSNTITNTNIKYLSTTSTDQNSYNLVSTAMNNYISFVKSAIDLLTSVLNILQKITENTSNIAPLVSTITSRLATLNTSESAMKLQLTSVTSGRRAESFVSYRNPYNQPSPNGTQAQEFRTGKKAYADEVFSAMKI